jgi:hypothetical protein
MGDRVKIMIRLGFTGTREKPTQEQRIWLTDQVLSYGIGEVDEFHHGCCQGSDEYAHTVAKACEVKLIVLHPPLKHEFEMKYTEWEYANCVWYPRKDYLARDRDIVDCSTRMYGLAKANTALASPHSGTWYTARQSIKRGRIIDMCYPSGKVVKY